MTAEVFLCLSWKSQHKARTPLGVNSPLNTTDINVHYSPQAKPEKKGTNKASSKAIDQRPGRRALAGSWHEGRSKFLQTHPDQRAEGKSRLTALPRSLDPFPYPGLVPVRSKSHHLHPMLFPRLDLSTMCEEYKDKEDYR